MSHLKDCTGAHLPIITIKLQDYEALPMRKTTQGRWMQYSISECLSRSRQCSSATQTLLLVTKAKCPTKNQYWANQLTKEMENVVRRNLKFVVYPKKSQEELSLLSANA